MSNKAVIAVLASLVSLAGAPSKVVFNYDEVDRFAAAHRSIQQGVTVDEAMKGYVDGASPAFKAFAKAYGTTAVSMAKEVTKRPKHYAALTQLRDRLKKMEPVIDKAIAKLIELAPEQKPVPVYFLVADMKAGGTPKELELPDGSKKIGILVGLEIMSVTPETDMAEFPNYRGVPVAFANVPQVVIHEMVHVFQAGTQGLDNYRSIFNPQVGTNLSIAIREGSAEFLTYLVSGLRLGDRHVYGEKHEKELWASFRETMDKPAFSVPGWFDGGIKEKPELPSQIGYWVGLEICRHYYDSSKDKKQAVSDLLGAYKAEQFRKIAEPYIARMKS